MFRIVDHDIPNHPNTYPEWLGKTYSSTVCVHLPMHASWLNQIDSYFSVPVSKLLNWIGMPDTDESTDRLLVFESFFSQDAKPFKWKFTADDLKELHERVPTLP